MIKETVFGIAAIAIIVIFFNVSYGSNLAISDKFNETGAPQNIIDHSQISYAIAFLLLIAGIIIFLFLRATRVEYETTWRK